MNLFRFELLKLLWNKFALCAVVVVLAASCFALIHQDTDIVDAPTQKQRIQSANFYYTLSAEERAAFLAYLPTIPDDAQYDAPGRYGETIFEDRRMVRQFSVGRTAEIQEDRDFVVSAATRSYLAAKNTYEQRKYAGIVRRYVDPVPLNYYPDGGLFVLTNTNAVGFLTLLLVVLFAGTVFSSERQNDAVLWLKPTPNGQKSVAKMKFAAVALVSAAISILTSVVTLGVVSMQFGLANLGAPAMSFPVLGRLPFGWSAAGFILCFVGLRLFGAVCFGLFCGFVSSFFKNNFLSYAVCLAAGGLMFGWRLLVAAHPGWDSMVLGLDLTLWATPTDWLLNYRTVNLFGFAALDMAVLVVGWVVGSVALCFFGVRRWARVAT